MLRKSKDKHLLTKCVQAVLDKSVHTGMSCSGLHFGRNLCALETDALSAQTGLARPAALTNPVCRRVFRCKTLAPLCQSSAQVRNSNFPGDAAAPAGAYDSKLCVRAVTVCGQASSGRGPGQQAHASPATSLREHVTQDAASTTHVQDAASGEQQHTETVRCSALSPSQFVRCMCCPTIASAYGTAVCAGQETTFEFPWMLLLVAVLCLQKPIVVLPCSFL